jgi:anaerobic selenocysteine-containing dehydrogenase
MDQNMSRHHSARRGDRALRHTGSPQRHRQRGMTFIGLLCILALVGTIGYAGLRLIPLYLNYMKVVRSMDATAAEFKGENPEQAGIRRSLEKHWQIEDISSVDAKDVEITKEDGVVTLHVAYDDAAPYISNVSLSVHFDKTVKVQ